MSYQSLNCAQQAELIKKRKNRISQVRNMSKVIAKQVRSKVQSEKQNQLSKIQEIKQRELNDWRTSKRWDIQQQCGSILTDLGAAHVAACNTSCEEGPVTELKREEYDLIAAERGRFSMLQQQRKRDREAEERLAKRKRKLYKNAEVQAVLITSATNLKMRNIDDNSENEGMSSGEEEVFPYKHNILRSSEHNYNAEKFTSHSVDSSNNCDSEDELDELESQEEFNQISNLLKKKCYDYLSPQVNFDTIPEVSSKIIEKTIVQNQLETLPKQKKKSILKNIKSPVKQLWTSERPETQNVEYTDFHNKQSRSYIPQKDLVTENRSTSDARDDAQKHEMKNLKGFNAKTMSLLVELRSKEALAKENIRRDYEGLRYELDDIAKQEEKAKEKASHIKPTNLSKIQRKTRMHEAVEDSVGRNILTCAPVDSNKQKKSTDMNLFELNVGNLNNDKSSITLIKPAEGKRASVNEGKANDIENAERLKILLEQINEQKRICLKQIEQSQKAQVSSLPDEQNEKTLQNSSNQLKKIKASDDLLSREMKLEHREMQFEKKIKELYKSQKYIQSGSSSTETSTLSEDAIAPVKIIIKVHQKPHKVLKSGKSYTFTETLNLEPKKVYARTPKKVDKSTQDDPAHQHLKPSEPEKIQKQTQTSTTSEPIKPILKKLQEYKNKVSNSLASEDSLRTVSTSYQSLPEKIGSIRETKVMNEPQPHHKLNPVLMHYISRLLGMTKHVGNQLSVSVSSVDTPGTSTINTSGNIESPENSQVPSFDQKRFEKLQDFINQNYSFLSEINDTLDRSVSLEQNGANVNTVEKIWRDVLRSKKPKSVKNESSKTKMALQKNSTREAKETCLSQGSRRKETNSQKNMKKSEQKTIIQPLQPAQQTEAFRRKIDITSKDMLNVTKYLESHMLNNFTEYTANCQKRIEELAKMMEHVREEKLKLIEHSLSSGEFGHFTEYKDIVFAEKNKYAPTTSASDIKDSPSQREDQPSEEINNILQKQMRTFGVSKDSGIQSISLLSRPVTSSDFRDSPEVRITSEERENTFQPILKDIPKPQKLLISEREQVQNIKDTPNIMLELEDKVQKKQKPPLSLNRFSPHLEKPHEAHELSTIVEVETPSASKVNLLASTEVFAKTKFDNQNIALKSFPNFEEYSKNLQAEATSASLFDLNQMKSALEELKINSFKDPQDFGIQSLSHDNDISSDSSSMLDIEEELKRRRIREKPFENKQTSNEGFESKTSQNIFDEEIVSDALTKPKGEKDVDFVSSESHSTLSGIQEIEKEAVDNLGMNLNRMGLNWAASMMKRDEESKKHDSGSSTSTERQKSIQFDIEVSRRIDCDISSSNSSSHPVNLRDFLTRELTRRSLANKSASNESSLSSQFMRSLLNASESTSSGTKSENSSERDKLRTSTPVATKENNRSQFQKSAQSQLFTGDSLSTLKASEADSVNSDEI